MVKLTQDEFVTVLLRVLSRDLEEIEGAFGVPVSGIPLRELNFDSLSILELAIDIEESYGISLNPGDFVLSPQATIGGLFDYVNNRSNE